MKLSVAQSALVADSDLALRKHLALHMAGLGFKIFPMGAGQKKPSLNDWPNQATSNPEKIKSWFKTHVNMNYGIACGASSLIVVDLDTKDGIDGIAQWERISESLMLAKTFTVITPSGGKHLYFLGEGPKNSAGTVAPGVDVRAAGGCVVGPGSQTEAGIYRSDPPWPFPDIEEVVVASESLKQLLTSRRASESLDRQGLPTAPGGAVSKPTSLALQKVLGSEALRLLSAHQGSRNDQLNKSSFEVGKALTEDPQTEALVFRALSSLGRELGLDTAETANTIRSGLKDGKLNSDPAGNVESLFEALDLAKWFTEPHPAPEVFGSGGVLYRPSLTWLTGEPASGKSMLCIVWASDVIEAGGRVLWLDEEAGPSDTIGKFRALGMSPEQLQSSLVYLPPMPRNLAKQVEEFHQFVEKISPELIVMDSAAMILANSGVEEDSNNGVSHFNSHVILPLVKKMGHSVLVIDHVPKNSNNTRYARGAGSKLSGVDMSLSVRTTKSFSKSSSGALELRVRKDRQGNLAEDTFWEVGVNVTGDGLRFDFSEPKDPTTKTAAVSDQGMRERIVEFVREHPGISKTEIEKVPGRKNETKRELLRGMISDGVLEDRGGRSGSSLFVVEDR